MNTEIIKEYKGYYFAICDHEYFVVTDRERITDKFVAKIAGKLGYTSERAKYFIKHDLTKSTCELKRRNFGIDTIDYYNIYGEYFGGCGTTVKDGHTSLLFL